MWQWSPDLLTVLATVQWYALRSLGAVRVRYQPMVESDFFYFYQSQARKEFIRIPVTQCQGGEGEGQGELQLFWSDQQNKSQQSNDLLCFLILTLVCFMNNNSIIGEKGKKQIINHQGWQDEMYSLIFCTFTPTLVKSVQSLSLELKLVNNYVQKENRNGKYIICNLRTSIVVDIWRLKKNLLDTKYQVRNRSFKMKNKK